MSSDLTPRFKGLEGNDIWLVTWGESSVEFIPGTSPLQPKCGYFHGLAERYNWEMECVREDGGFKRVFAMWMAGKCYSLAHWLESVESKSRATQFKDEPRKASKDII